MTELMSGWYEVFIKLFINKITISLFIFFRLFLLLFFFLLFLPLFLFLLSFFFLLFLLEVVENFILYILLEVLHEGVLGDHDFVPDELTPSVFLLVPVQHHIVLLEDEPGCQVLPYVLLKAQDHEGFFLVDGRCPHHLSLGPDFAGGRVNPHFLLKVSLLYFLLLSRVRCFLVGKCP